LDISKKVRKTQKLYLCQFISRAFAERILVVAPCEVRNSVF